MENAYIFDFDGTLVDTMPLYYDAWTHVLKEEIGDIQFFTKDLFYLMAGQGCKTIVRKLNEEFNLSLNIQKVENLLAEKFYENIESIKIRRGIFDLAKNLKKFAKIGIATSNSRIVIDRILEHLPSDFMNYFDVIVTREDVKATKPAPDLFLKTAELLNVEPENCIVFEDAIMGVQAAKNANMAYLWVPPLPESR